MSKANVAKQAAKASADKSAKEKSAAAFQAHKKATLAKGGRPVDALDSWNKKKLNKEAIDPKGGGVNPDLSNKQQNTERKQTDSQREKVRKQRELIAKMRQQDVSMGRQPSGHTAREEVEIDERLGGKGYSKTAMKGSIHPPSQKSTGDWEDSDRGEGNKAKRRAGEKVKAKSPTYTAYVKNKNEAYQPSTLNLKKNDAGAFAADKKSEGMDKQLATKEKKVAIMKRQILQKKVQAVRAGATGDVVAHFEPEGQVLEGKYRVLAKTDKDNKPSQFSYQDEKTAKKFADSIKKGGGRATVSKEETVVELNRYEKETGKSSGSMNMPKGTPTEKGGSSSRVMRAVRTSIRKETGKPSGQRKKEKGLKSTAGTGKYLEKQKSKKDYADRAKKAGFKNTQDYTNTVARYGSEDNYKKGRGLGT